MNIDDDPSINNWLNHVCLSKTNNTRELYLTVMRKYCRIIGLTPARLIEQCENEASLPLSKQSIPTHIGTFKNFLREHMSRGSRVTYLAAVSSFYSYYDIAISKKLLKREAAPQIQIENDLSLTDEIITRAMSCSDALTKTTIAIQYSSGLSMSDVLELKAGKIRENLAEDNITCLGMERQKTGVRFVTFLSPTATELCIGRIAAMNLEDADYLICTEKGTKLKENNFLQLYRDVSYNLGLRIPGFREYNKFHSHNLRKMFYNSILNIGGWGMGELAEYFMGHKIPATRAAYFKATPEKLKEEYKKFVSHFESVLNGVKKKDEMVL